MKFEKSPYFEKLKPYKLELPFGNYYLCNNFFIGELHEGVHFDWKKTELLVEEIIKFYGKLKPVAFISNRINSYSVDPQNWIKIEEKYNILVASAIVVYNNSNYINASLEKHFAKKSIKRCLSLSEAIGWVQNLDEFN